MAADIGEIMVDIAAQLATIPDLRVFAFPPNSAQPPFAFVNMPEEITYDATFGRGFDSFTVDVYVGVANVVDRAAANAMQVWASGGEDGIKAAIELDRTNYRVSKATFSTIGLAAQSYAGIIFQVDITA